MEEGILYDGGTKRQCGSCTLCCEGWISTNINGIELSPGKACRHCTGKGCSIYETRPAVPCAKFKCGWLMEQSPLPDHMIPEKSGAIVLLDRKWKGVPCICALPTGPTVPSETLEWLLSFSRKVNIPLIFFENVFENGEFLVKKQTGYGPPSFVEKVRNSIGSEDIQMS